MAKKQLTDDWGTALGQSPEKETPVIKTSTVGLPYYFRDSLPASMSSLYSTINGPALSKGFAHMRKEGLTTEDIKATIDKFMQDIVAKPLPSHVVPWRGFLARVDELVKWSKTNQTEDLTAHTIDPRLKK
jgi:hypothetical protein